MQSQANLLEIRHAIDEMLNASDAERLALKYEPEGSLPAAAIVRIDGVELRLEKDCFDGLWTVATNESAPRLLDRVSNCEMRKSVLRTLRRSLHHLYR